jgi:hypothetical protein
MNQVACRKYLYAVVVFLITMSGYSAELLKDVSIYPIGIVKHFKVQAETNDGNLNYFAASKSIKKNKWTFENGAGTFVDTYHKRAFVVFSNITHDRYKYGVFTPMLNVHCAYKGHSYKEDNRKLQCYPLFKLRIGREKGLFTNIIPLPKIGDVTNGLVAFEVGYKF